MARELTPEQAAKRIRDWNAAGFSIAVVDSLLGSLEVDKRESQARVPHKTGALAKSIRVVKPRVRTALSRGAIVAKLSAGSKGKRGVAYARILQEGGQTKPHDIEAKRRPGVLAFTVQGQKRYATSVHHPGSRFRRLNYLQIREDRLAVNVNKALTTSAEQALGG